MATTLLLLNISLSLSDSHKPVSLGEKQNTSESLKALNHLMKKGNLCEKSYVENCTLINLLSI